MGGRRGLREARDGKFDLRALLVWNDCNGIGTGFVIQYVLREHLAPRWTLISG
jgi:hypothetical protein